MAHAYFLHEERQSIHYFQMNILICVTKTVIWAKDDFPRHRDENKIYVFKNQTKLIKSAKLIKTVKALGEKIKPSH